MTQNTLVLDAHFQVLKMGIVPELEISWRAIWFLPLCWICGDVSVHFDQITDNPISQPFGLHVWLVV